MTATLPLGAEVRDPAAIEPRVRGPIAVLMLRFPHLADTFILREINELERQGQPVLVVPILEGDRAVLHEESRPWISRALFTPLLSWSITRSNVAVFLRKPLTYLRLLGKLIAGTIVRPSTLLRTVALFPKSVHLSVVLRERGVSHLHAHFATHATTMAYIIASLSDLTYSFTVHGPDVFVHRRLLREKIRKATVVRAVSVFNKAFLSGLYPDETAGKIEVIRTGVNPDVYADAAAAAEPVERPMILSVAELTPTRGFPYLVDACARLAKEGVDADCRIVGDGPLRATTEQWIAEHRIADKVQLLGALPQHEVAALIGRSDIFVLPSIVAVNGQMDGIPVSLMEAMAAGKPVIASATSGIPELVRHDVSGLLVDASHPERVAQAILRLLRDPALRERLGRAGQVKVRESFDIRRNITGLVALLDGHQRTDDSARTIAERIAALNWDRLHVKAVGVRRVHDRTDAYVAEVTISDGSRKREVVVRQPSPDFDDGVSPLDRARHEFEVISMLSRTLDVDGDQQSEDTTRFSVPRLLMFDEPNAALVVERADGRSLAGIVEGSMRGRRTTEALRRAGRWLRVMQTRTRSGDDGRHLLTAVVLLALRDLDLAAASDRRIASMHHRILETLQELESRRSELQFPVVGQHGDYRLDNIFIGQGRVDVTGFGRYREGLPLEDVAQFLLDLEIRSHSLLAWRRVSALRDAFLEGYGASLASLERDALRLFTIAKALDMLAHPGYERSGTTSKLRTIVSRSLS